MLSLLQLAQLLSQLTPFLALAVPTPGDSPAAPLLLQLHSSSSPSP